MRRLVGFIAVVGLLGAGCARVEAADAEGPDDALRQASVTVAGRCAGVVVEGSRHLVTAAHCIRDGEEFLGVELADGTPVAAHVIQLDRDTDMVILGVDQRLPVNGLRIADRLPEPGAPLLFTGRVDWGARAQRVTVERLGRCPSLPGVPEALFTSLRGRKGDSGAPIVDEDLRVVGLVHGGAACSIAAPTHKVPGMLRALLTRS